MEGVGGGGVLHRTSFTHIAWYKHGTIGESETIFFSSREVGHKHWVFDCYQLSVIVKINTNPGKILVSV